MSRPLNEDELKKVEELLVWLGPGMIIWALADGSGFVVGEPSEVKIPPARCFVGKTVAEALNKMLEEKV